MSFAEWTAWGAFAFAVVGGMIQVVWLLSKIHTKLGNMTIKQDEMTINQKSTNEKIEAHMIECAADKAKLATIVDNHDKRLDHYGQRISTLEAR